MGILRSDRVSGLGGANAIKGSVEMRAGQNMRAEIVNGNADFNLGSSDFTIECWYNPGGTTGTSNSLDVDLLMLWNNTNNRRSYGLYRDSSGSLGLIGSSDGTNSDMQSYHSYNFSDVNAWYHIAAVRISNTATIYVNGTSIGSATVSGSFYENTVDNLVVGGQLAGTSYDSKIARGFISNMRLIIGDGIYTGAFTPPANELTVTPNTKLLCCQSPGNILQEATGKTLVAYRSSTNDSFAKASTFVPDKGEDYGTTFEDNTKFDTLSYMVPPGGTTTQRGRGTALFAGGYITPNATADIEYLSIPSGGITTKWGSLSTTQLSAGQSLSSKTRQLIGGGWASPINNNTIEYVEIATSGNSITFSDLVVGRRGSSPVSNDTRGIWGGGYISPADAGTPTMDYVTIATTANAQDFGDLSGNAKGGTATGSTTRAVFALGNVAPVDVNTLEYITIASTGDYTNFGDLPSGSYGRDNGSTSSNTRGIFAGGHYPTSVNIINYITIATTGDATDFGDLFLARGFPAGTSNGIRGVFMGGTTNPARQDTIDSVIIATTGNAVNWGDMRVATQAVGGSSSDSHGGLS